MISASLILDLHIVTFRFTNNIQINTCKIDMADHIEARDFAIAYCNKAFDLESGTYVPQRSDSAHDDPHLPSYPTNTLSPLTDDEDTTKPEKSAGASCFPAYWNVLDRVEKASAIHRWKIGLICAGPVIVLGCLTAIAVLTAKTYRRDGE